MANYSANSIARQRKLFARLNVIMDNLEDLVGEAHKQKGWTFVHDEPLWCTWTLERFGEYIISMLHEKDYVDSDQQHRFLP